MAKKWRRITHDVGPSYMERGRGGRRRNTDYYVTETRPWHLPQRRMFCKSCYGVGNAERCCGVETAPMSFLAQPPRKDASKRQWEKFFRRYPDLRPENSAGPNRRKKSRYVDEYAPGSSF